MYICHQQCVVHNRDFRKATNRIGQALKGETQGHNDFHHPSINNDVSC